jgi:hypothetical protein
VVCLLVCIVIFACELTPSGRASCVPWLVSPEQFEAHLYWRSRVSLWFQMKLPIKFSLQTEVLGSHLLFPLLVQVDGKTLCLFPDQLQISSIQAVVGKTAFPGLSEVWSSFMCQKYSRCSIDNRCCYHISFYFTYKDLGLREVK